MSLLPCCCQLLAPQLQNWLLHRCSTVQCRPLHRLTPVCHPAALLLLSPACSRTNILSWSLDLSPPSLGFSPSTQSGRCSSSARFCAAQGRMSACRTRPAANPGGPQGGAQTGRRPGGGAGRKLSRPRSETKCCGGFPGTPPGPFSALERTRRLTHGRPEFKNRLQITKCAAL